MNLLSRLVVLLLNKIYYRCIKRVPYTFNNYSLSRVADFLTKGVARCTMALASFILTSIIFFKEIFSHVRNYWR